MTKNKIMEALSILGLLLVAASMLMPIFYGPTSLHAKILLTAGAVLLFVGRIFSPYKGNDFRVKRLYAMLRWSPIAFGVGAYFIWTSNTPSDWIVFVLAGAFIQLYISFALPGAIKKSLQKDNSTKKQ